MGKIFRAGPGTIWPMRVSKRVSKRAPKAVPIRVEGPHIKLIVLAALVALFFGVRLGILSYTAKPAGHARDMEKDIIDVHTHVACTGTEGDDCYVSPEMKRSYKYSLYIRVLGTTEQELKEKGDGIILERLSARIRASARVKKAVVLALDGVVKDGKLDRSRTEVYVPNEFVAREVAKYDNLLFGASINPYRTDALQRLLWAKNRGAVLIKWIPSIMGINPSDPAIIPFYKKVKQLGLPLLIHTGDERTFTHAQDDLSDPLKLELPLSIGVTVIAAHMSASGETAGEPNFDRLLTLFKKYPTLYADISALTQINLVGYLSRATRLEVLRGRLVYGSDWPLQFFPLVSPWWQLWGGAITPWEALWVTLSTDNEWDADILVKKYVGVSDDVFLNSAKLLRIL